MSLKAALKQRALEVGFDLVGIAPLTPGRDLEFARAWVERGYGGEMRYLSNPQRFDPRQLLRSVRSVICVGLMYDTPAPYSTEAGSGRKSGVGGRESGFRSQKSGARSQNESPGQAPADNRPRTPERVSSFEFPVSGFQFPISSPGTLEGAPHAWISRYAWGRDYHEIVRRKLERLRAAVEALAPGVETRLYVDTGPVVERAFARFSGIGWMGKNTCIINEPKGSWFFLGVILTNLDLELDVPALDRCGSCTRCLEACPTTALVEPYVMDASRCISYLTIELKGSIPGELRSGVGANIFGCDICQEVCPWNGRPSSVVNRPLQQTSNQGTTDHGQRTKDSGQRTDERFSSFEFPVSLFNPPLERLTAITEQDFRQVFRHSPIKRVKSRGWLRNLCVAIGNSGDPRFIPKLRELSQDADLVVREHAAWALGRLKEPL